MLETLLSVFINAKLHILVNKYPEGRVLEYTDHRKLESGPMNGKKLDTREIATIATIDSSGISGVKMKDSS